MVQEKNKNKNLTFRLNFSSFNQLSCYGAHRALEQSLFLPSYFRLLKSLYYPISFLPCSLWTSLEMFILENKLLPYSQKILNFTPLIANQHFFLFLFSVVHALCELDSYFSGKRLSPFTQISHGEYKQDISALSLPFSF